MTFAPRKPRNLNMIFLVIKGSPKEAEEEASRRGLYLVDASKHKDWNNTLGYIRTEYEYNAEQRIIEWFNETSADDGFYLPGALLWYALASNEARTRGTRQ